MPFVRSDVQAFLDRLKAFGGPTLRQLGPEAGRQVYKAMGPMVELPRGTLARVAELVIPSPQGHSFAGRLYAAHEAPEPGPVLVFFHGGGWVIGDLDTHDGLCAEIARQLHITVLSIDYRLAPEHSFPAAVEDALAAARWAAASPGEIGHAVTGLVVAGDSAGGNLAAVCAQELTGQLLVPVLAQWLIYPGVDFLSETNSLTEFGQGYVLTQDDIAFFHSHYLPNPADRGHIRASPLRASSLAGQPPTLVFTCGLDPLRDQGRAYAAMLIEHGVSVRFREAAGQVHGCFNLRQAIPSAQRDLLGCLADLRAMIREAQSASHQTGADQ
ncbi:MAG: alpha/beta hydrolase [Gemmatimonadales bacterium]